MPGRARSSCAAGPCRRAGSACPRDGSGPHTACSSWRCVSTQCGCAARWVSSRYSIGVTWTGFAGAFDRCAAPGRSCTSPNSTTAAAPCAVPPRAAQMRPHARQQLAGAERLDEVVVGAGVERLDLVLLAGAGRQHEDGHVRPGAQVADQVDAVAVRQAEVEHDQVRPARACLDQAALARRRPRRPRSPRAPARGTRSAGSRASSSTTRIRGRRFAHAEHPCDASDSIDVHRRRLAARQVDREARAAAGPRLAGDGAAVRLDDGAADRQAQADAGRGAFLAAALEHLEDRLLAVPRQARSVVVDRDLDTLGRRPRRVDLDRRARRACTWRRSPAGCTAPARTAPHRRAPAAGPAGSDTRTRRGSSVPSMARKALPIASSSGSHCRFSCTWPDCRRAMSSRLFTCELMRSAASRIDRASSACRPPGDDSRHRQRVGHADQRRQRRAQVVRNRGQQRIAQALRLHLHRRALRHVDVVDALQRDREQRRAGVEQAALLRPGQPRRVARLDRQHAAHAHRRLQRQVEDGRRPARCWCRARPPRRGRTPIARRRCRCPTAASGDGHGRVHAVLQIGHQQRGARLELRLQEARRDLGDLLGHAARRTGRATSRRARARAPRAASRRAPGTSGRPSAGR